MGASPVCQRVTVVAGDPATAHRLQNDANGATGPTSWFNIKNEGPDPVRLYFSKDAADLGDDYRLLQPNEVFEGPWSILPRPEDNNGNTNVGPPHIWLERPGAIGASNSVVSIVTGFSHAR